MASTVVGSLVKNVVVRSKYSGLELGARHWVSPEQDPAEKQRINILAVHGWLDNAASFDLMATSIMEASVARRVGCELVALDLPGHGRSGWRPGERSHYNYPEYVADIVGVLEELQWGEGTVLLGHSMGGGLALLASAVLGSPKVSRSVLIEGLGPVTCSEEKVVESLRDAIGNNMRFFAADAHQRREYPSAEHAVEARLKATPYMSRESASLLVDRDLQAAEGGVGVLLSKDPTAKLSSLLRYTEGQVHAMIEALQVPVLVVEGTDPWMRNWMNLQQMQARLELLSSAGRLHALITVSGGHHHLHMEPASLQHCLPSILDFIFSSQDQE